MSFNSWFSSIKSDFPITNWSELSQIHLQLPRSVCLSHHDDFVQKSDRLRDQWKRKKAHSSSDDDQDHLCLTVTFSSAFTIFLSAFEKTCNSIINSNNQPDTRIAQVKRLGTLEICGFTGTIDCFWNRIKRPPNIRAGLT